MDKHEPKTRFVDKQGRIIIPAHIRNDLNIGTGHTVTIEQEGKDSIRIRVVPDRCCICGDAVDNKRFTNVPVGSETKPVCFDCAQAVAKSMMR